MEQQRFDALAKWLAKGISRRRLVTAGAVVVAGQWAGGSMSRAAGATPTATKPCRPGIATPRATPVASPAAAPAAAAISCDANELCCGGQCVNPEQDRQHCGGCNHRCPEVAGSTCVFGHCCQAEAGRHGSCSTALTCCAGMECRDGRCCIEPYSPRVCYTDEADMCCSGRCDPDDPHLGINAPGHLEGTCR